MVAQPLSGYPGDVSLNGSGGFVVGGHWRSASRQDEAFKERPLARHAPRDARSWCGCMCFSLVESTRRRYVAAIVRKCQLSRVWFHARNTNHPRGGFFDGIFRAACSDDGVGVGRRVSIKQLSPSRADEL